MRKGVYMIASLLLVALSALGAGEPLESGGISRAWWLGNLRVGGYGNRWVWIDRLQPELVTTGDIARGHF